MSSAFHNYRQRCAALEKELEDMKSERDHYFNLSEFYRCTPAAPTKDEDPSDLEKIPEAARRCGISVSVMYRLIKAGEIGPIIKTGKRASAISKKSTDAWIRRKVSTTACGSSGERA